VVAPLQSVWLAGAIAVGIGFTVMVKLELDPEQVTPLFKYCGVAVIVAITGFELLTFDPMNEAMFPTPLFANPMEGVVFVQL
jgi:hypothetical protein